MEDITDVDYWYPKRVFKNLSNKNLGDYHDLYVQSDTLLYSDNVKLCYVDTDSFIMHIKTEDFYIDIADDVEKRFDTSNYECDRPLPTGKNKKVIGLMKDELGGGL